MKPELIKKEGNSVNFEIAIEAAEFEKAIDKAYNKTKSRYNIHGFRKGKAPRKIIELNYGKGVFFNDALDIIIPEIYPTALDELDISAVSQPQIDIKELNDDNSLILVVDVDVKPEFEIENYFGVEVKKEEAEVTDEKIDAELKNLVERQARQIDSDAAIENGNIVDIDFTGLLDGEEFEGGSAKGYSLEIGSGAFIPGFEEQLIGKNKDEDVDVNVTFPEDYPQSNLAGKDVVFKVKINGVKVKESPELNDEFVQDTTEFESLEELKNDIRENILKREEQAAKDKMSNEVIDKVAALVDIDIPDSMVEYQLDRQMNELETQLSYQGWNLENFAQLSGQTVEEIRSARKEDAKNIVKSSLVIEKIAKLENVEATEEDLNNELEKFGQMYGLEIDKVKEMLGEAELDSFKDRVVNEKTIELLLSKATLV